MASMKINSYTAGIAAAFCALSGSAIAAAPGPAPVNLGKAGDFVILSESGITELDSPRGPDSEYRI